MSEHFIKDISLERLFGMISTAIGPQVVDLLHETKVTDVIANSDGKLWVERLGQDMVQSGTLSSDARMTVIKLVAGSIKAPCNADNPTITAELLLDGSRFQGGIPPIASGPFFCIRKKARQIITLDEYVQQGFLTPEQRDKILDYIKKKKNILVVGGTGSGKTTFLNGILHAIGSTKDRIIIIEDTCELQCDAENTEFLRSNKNYSMNNLLKDTLRLRPNRIILGEVRGDEAHTLIKAWNTGHPGGLATVHADSARDGLERLEELVQEANVTPIPKRIARAINVIIFLEKEDNIRKVKEILEVQYLHGDYIFQDAI